MRLPIKYELLFRGEDVEATIDVGLDQFPAETHNRSRQIALTKRLKEYLKTKGIDAIEIDGGLNGYRVHLW